MGNPYTTCSRKPWYLREHCPGAPPGCARALGGYESGMSLVLTWLISSAAVWLTAQILPGFTVNGFKGALISSAVIGLLEVLVGWLLFFVIGIGTLGIGFLLAFVTHVVVTAILILLTDRITTSLKVRSFGTAFIGAIMIGAVSSVLTRVLH
jgi:putative membrane protein